MTTQTTPLQHADYLFVEPDLGGYGFVRRAAAQHERQRADGREHNERQDTSTPRPRARWSKHSGFSVAGFSHRGTALSLCCHLAFASFASFTSFRPLSVVALFCVLVDLIHDAPATQSISARPAHHCSRTGYQLTARRPSLRQA